MALPAALKATNPAEYAITVKKGATFYQEFEHLDGVTAIDLTGVTGAAMIRETFTAASPIATFAVTIPSPTNGTVIIQLAPATTTALSATFNATTDRERQVWFWDLELSDGTDVVRTVQGTVTFSREATFT